MLITTSDSKQQSAPDQHRHNVEHSTRCVLGGMGLRSAREMVQNDAEVVALLPDALFFFLAELLAFLREGPAPSVPSLEKPASFIAPGGPPSGWLGSFVGTRTGDAG